MDNKEKDPKQEHVTTFSGKFVGVDKNGGNRITEGSGSVRVVGKYIVCLTNDDDSIYALPKSSTRIAVRKHFDRNPSLTRWPSSSRIKTTQ